MAYGSRGGEESVRYFDAAPAYRESLGSAVTTAGSLDVRVVVVSSYSYPRGSSSYREEGGEGARGARTLDVDLSLSSRRPGLLERSLRRESRGSRDIVFSFGSAQSITCEIMD
jgi:hypothetical protein